ncbi:hypothetical protein F2Q69_00027492 [Brassica cretica]|uniref:Uncharacterized protein n=1 Tax=Brassica cretica TaxID=69181 RepID=A0A8S9RQS2_BRACR|nr:hypothetical protein F2Q69_00027492 [Brassica cretica]
MVKEKTGTVRRWRSVVSGLLALLKVERDKIGAAPYDGCVRTLVEGIKPFVVRLGVKCVNLAGFLKTLEYWQRDKFWDLVSRFLILCLEMLETSALGLGQDLGKCFYRGRKFHRRTNLQASATSREAEDLLFFRMPHFVLEMFAGLKMFCDVARV